MNFYNKIAPLHYRLLALGLLLFFVIPPVLKTLHSYEFHSSQKDCEHSTTHLHSSSIHNDVLDYYFQPLIEYCKNYSTFFIKISFKTAYDNYRLCLEKQRFYKLRLRGPPSFLLKFLST